MFSQNNGTLIDALATSDSDSQAVIAQTLAMIDDSLAQHALIEQALENGLGIRLPFTGTGNPGPAD